jgi:hypothetical protein
MRDLMKWNIALARLSNFIEKFPSCPDEDHMFQYHKIIGLFEEPAEICFLSSELLLID